ncbi:amino acid ABC transporter permease|jgi:polar amino acid transport system permease protein|uniref:amino acid ABC transporter permease n=1 Tax=Pseudomonas sp. SbOxS1 TaxID=2723884 RepID=UPI000D818EF7|nr:amino acid ABC transporter permease [Pseudomonas sp. SbOxS1]NYU02577.1 amino acid ABC transporter permease [Pseudomonas sp. SbOxS1]
MNLFNFSVVLEYWPVFLKGLGLTVLLTVIVFSLSAVLAVPVALAQLSRYRLLRTLAHIYVEVMRGTPVILQLIYVYYVFPIIGIKVAPFSAAVIGLSMSMIAYLSEVYRGGINGIAQGQREAAAAMGMSDFQAFRRVILPQAIRLTLPSLGNYLIALFKDSALASVVTLQELMFAGQIIAVRNYEYFTVYTVCGVLYLAVSYPCALLVRRLEKRTQGGYRRNVARVAPAPSGSAVGESS